MDLNRTAVMQLIDKLVADIQSNETKAEIKISAKFWKETGTSKGRGNRDDLEDDAD